MERKLQKERRGGDGGNKREMKTSNKRKEEMKPE